jgi:tetratricopeptide (TPR) repeat protein
MDRRSFTRLATIAAAVAPGIDWQSRLQEALDRPSTVDASMITALAAVTARLRRVDDLVGAGVRREVEEQLGLTWRLVPELPLAHARRQLATVAGDVAQLAGWLAFDGGENEVAESRYRQGMQAARLAGNDELYAYLLASTAHLLANVGETDEALACVAIAARVAQRRPSAVTQAHIAVVEANIHSRRGDATATDRALDQADVWFTQIESVDVPPWLYYFDRAELLCWHGSAALRLGRLHAAQAALEERLALLDRSLLRERAFATADLAACHVRGQEVDQGVRLAIEALEMANGMKSVRVVDRVAALRRSLPLGAGWRALRELDERLRLAS